MANKKMHKKLSNKSVIHAPDQKLKKKLGHQTLANILADALKKAEKMHIGSAHTSNPKKKSASLKKTTNKKRISHV